MQMAIAGVAGLDPNKVILITKELGYLQKRNTLYGYMELRTSTRP
jgi:hypothetical protein